MIERVIVALKNSGNDRRRAAAYARERWGPGAEWRSLDLYEVEGGGALVGPEVDRSFIHALRARSVVRRMGASTTPIGYGKSLGRITSGAASYWIGASETVEASQPTLGNVHLDERKLGTFVPISNSLLRYSPDLAEDAIRQDMLLASAAAEDASFLRGTGAEYAPRGLRYQAAAANVIASLEAAMAALEDASVPMLRPGWILSPRSRRYLSTLRWAADGGFVFKDELAAGTLFGYPFGQTTGIPDNLGGGGDESEILFADFSEVVIGDGQSRLELANGPAYVQSAVLKAAFSMDVSCARHIRTVDLAMRHNEAIAVVTGVQWGA